MSNSTRRPTVGDTVRVVKTDAFTDAAELKLGETYKIRHDDHSYRPYRLHSNPGTPSNVYCFAYSFELVDATNPELEALKTSHAKMAEQIKELEAKLAKEAEAVKCPELALGQLWKYKDGTVYLVTRYDGKFNVVCVDSRSNYNTWAGNAGFNGWEFEFSYLGMASDLMTIKEPTK